MKPQDIRELNRQTNELHDAFAELERLAELAEDDADGVTVEPYAYKAAQQRAKAAVTELLHHGNDVADRTDVLEADDGTTRVQLPDAAVARDGPDTTLPSK